MEAGESFGVDSGAAICSICSAAASCCSTGRETAWLLALSGFLRRLDFAVLTGKSESGLESQGRGARKGSLGTSTGDGSGAATTGGIGSLVWGVGGVGGGSICDEWVEDGV